MRLFKTPLFYFNIALVVVIGLLITSVNANQTNFPALAKKAIAAIQQITGQGELNKLAAFSGTNAIGNSQIFDNGTNVGIGTIVPIGKLHAVSDTAGDFIGISNSSVSSFAYMTQSGDIVGSGVGYANDFCTWSGKCLSATGTVNGTVSAGGVSKIIAGRGMTISPVSGVGDVTLTPNYLPGAGIGIAYNTNGAAIIENNGVIKITAGNGIKVDPYQGNGAITISNTGLIPPRPATCSANNVGQIYHYQQSGALSLSASTDIVFCNKYNSVFCWRSLIGTSACDQYCNCF